MKHKKAKGLRAAFIALLLMMGAMTAHAEVYAFILSCGKEVYIEVPGELTDEGILSIMDTLEEELCNEETEDPGEGGEN